ncbi:alpha/beta hydrolase [Catenulispora yoronensis]
MSTILLAHGYAMAPDQHWYPWLGEELSTAGHTVVVPPLPDAAAPDPDAWHKVLLAAADAAPADTVLVGHSLGGVSLLRLLQEHDTERHGAYRGLVLVASMAGEVGYDQLAGFFHPAFDWARIRAAAGTVRALHAADDPVTGAATPQHIMDFATRLGAEVIVTPDGGHFPTVGESRTELRHALELVRSLAEGRSHASGAERGDTK